MNLKEAVSIPQQQPTHTKLIAFTNRKWRSNSRERENFNPNKTRMCRGIKSALPNDELFDP
jgi:hypothetical protein